VYNLRQKLEALRRQAEYGLDVGEKEEKSAFLTYLLSQSELSPEEVNSNCVDLFIAATETVLLVQWLISS